MRYVLLFALAWLLGMPAAAEPSAKNVLVLFSSNRLLPANVQIDVSGLPSHLAYGQ
jgi:hypothetical protein